MQLRVAPRTGAWIETLGQDHDKDFDSVAPRTGAWIETKYQNRKLMQLRVAPRTGAWIETVGHCIDRDNIRSHPARVRGLKPSGIA